MLGHGERIQLTISKGKGPCGQSGGHQAQASVSAHRTGHTYVLPAMRCDNTHGLPGQLIRDSALRVYSGGWSHRSLSWLVCKFPTPGRKAGVQLEPYCLLSLDTVSGSCQFRECWEPSPKPSFRWPRATPQAAFPRTAVRPALRPRLHEGSSE